MGEEFDREGFGAGFPSLIPECLGFGKTPGLGQGRERRNNRITWIGSFSKGLSLRIFQREEIKRFAALGIMGGRERGEGFLGMGEFLLE